MGFVSTFPVYYESRNSVNKKHATYKRAAVKEPRLDIMFGCINLLVQPGPDAQQKWVVCWLSRINRHIQRLWTLLLKL